MPFDRVINNNDIAQLILKFEDGTSKCYYPIWDGESDYNNKYQTSIVSEVNGSLFIVINEKQTVQEIFKNKINSDDDFHWQMYRD